MQFATKGLLRNLLSLTTGELTSRLIGFVAFALLARRLEPSAYGAIEFAAALAFFFATFVDFGLESVGARAIARDPDQAARLASQIPAARLIMALLAIPLMGAVAMITGQPEATIHLVWIYSISLLAVPFFQRWLFQGLEMMDWVSIGQVLRSSVFCIALVILVQEPDDLLAAGFAEVVAAFAAMLFYLGVQSRRVASIGLTFSPAAIVALFRQSTPIGLSQIVWAANQYLPTALVAGLAVALELSWFGAAQRIVFSIVAFSWVYHFNLFPSLARNLAESRSAFDALVGASFRCIAWASIMASLAAAMFADTIISAVFSATYAAAAAPFALLVWAIPITLLSGHARITLIAGGEQRFVLASQIAGIATTVVVGLIAIPAYGALGGAATVVVSYAAVWAAAHFFAVRRVASLPLLSVLRPLVAAAIAYALYQALAPGNLAAGAAALIGYAAFGLAVDRKIIADIRMLASARRGPRDSGPLASDNSPV
jgi:O-antigen/teichoic acid export membrane protein